MHAFLFLAFIAAVHTSCRSAAPREQNLPQCLQRTDFTGYNPQLRADTAWLIEYGYKVEDTKCCALEPRTSLLAKRGDLADLRSELLARIDVIEKSRSITERGAASTDACYSALMNLWHDTVHAAKR